MEGSDLSILKSKTGTPVAGTQVEYIRVTKQSALSRDHRETMKVKSDFYENVTL